MLGEAGEAGEDARQSKADDKAEQDSDMEIDVVAFDRHLVPLLSDPPAAGLEGRVSTNWNDENRNG
jgi:hypothetical protein